MVKGFLIGLAVIIIIMAAVLFLYRYTIIQYSVEQLIRNNLPPYIQLGKISFDFASGAVILGDLKLLAPPQFPSKYLVDISAVSCKYRVKGRPIPNGIEISQIVVKKPDIVIERLEDGRINVVQMQGFINSLSAKSAPVTKAEDQKPAENRFAGRKLSDIIKLPGSFLINGGKITFIDRMLYAEPYITSIDYIGGEISINFDENYSSILNMSFTLKGNLNGRRDQAIEWVAHLDPATPRLTMSNRFEVSDLDILSLEPYYDQYSPFVFKKGRFSGTLVFDFDNGAIGSTDEIRLSNIGFFVKPGYENAQMWETNVPDLMRYFTTTSGDIVFDFRIKGDMSKPEFFLGPISKRALTNMAIDKVTSYAVQQVAKQNGGAAANIDKAQGYIDMFKGFLQKK